MEGDEWHDLSFVMVFGVWNRAKIYRLRKTFLGIVVGIGWFWFKRAQGVLHGYERNH